MNLQKYFGFMAILAALTVAPIAMADDDNHRHTTHASAKKGGYISAQKAGQIARSRVKNSRVQKVEFDGDDNYGAVYEVELVAGRGVEYDVKINAKTGKVIYVRADR